jgi:hypothetical protein
MTKKYKDAIRNQLERLVPIVLGLPWMEIAAELWKLSRSLWRGMADEGMYEVPEHESRLEILDKKGRRARFLKRQKVKYLQNNIIAYQDQAWADGKFLLGYRCSPGKAVDHYRLGRTTHILISLREMRSRGDKDEFNMEWGMRNSFQNSVGRWETTVSHRTKLLRVKVVFPVARFPERLSLVESLGSRTRPLGQEARTRLPDGRLLVTWEKRNPRLHERYVLKWEW